MVITIHWSCFVNTVSTYEKAIFWTSIKNNQPVSYVAICSHSLYFVYLPAFLNTSQLPINVSVLQIKVNLIYATIHGCSINMILLHFQLKQILCNMFLTDCSHQVECIFSHVNGRSFLQAGNIFFAFDHKQIKFANYTFSWFLSPFLSCCVHRNSFLFLLSHLIPFTVLIQDAAEITPHFEGQ